MRAPNIANHLQALVSAIVLTSCSTPHGPEVWIGSTFDQIREAFGDPEVVAINARSNRVYAFQLEQVEQRDTQLIYGTGEAVIADGGCVVMFEFAEETASRWQWDAQACGGVELPMPYQFRSVSEVPRAPE